MTTDGDKHPISKGQPSEFTVCWRQHRQGWVCMRPEGHAEDCDHEYEDRGSFDECALCGDRLDNPEPECNGICLFGTDIGIPSDAIAAAHPDCELHGHLALFNVDGSPRT